MRFDPVAFAARVGEILDKGFARLLERLTPLEVLPARVAALEARPVPRDGRDGLPGPPGSPGRDGVNGAEGLAGLGFQELAIGFTAPRTLTFTLARDGVTKNLHVELTGLPYYRGTYTPTESYVCGDRVTDHGSDWHCNEATTTRPGDGSAAWTLAVKRGRDGKDLR